MNRETERSFIISMVQFQTGMDREENWRRGEVFLNQAAREGAKLVLFPELSFLPFFPGNPSDLRSRRFSEPVPGPTTEFIARLARKLAIIAVINLFEKFDGKTYDTTVIIESDGSILGINRMVHILEAPGFHEKQYYSPGCNDGWIFDSSLGKLAVAVCYDRHFPEYMRFLALQQAELILIPQAGAAGEWPEGLYEAEVQTAAFQNGYYIALCNRFGSEPPLEFNGKSMMIAPDGTILKQAMGGEQLLSAEIDLSRIASSPARKHFLLDRRPELYHDWFSG